MRLYVGNLSKDVTKEDLQEAFAPFGQLDEVTIVKDRSNSVSKGFGFVEMPVKAEAEAAIAALHGKEFKGRSMDVNEARPRTERPSSGGFGGHGRGGRRGGGGRRW
jgi:RNA recognition motif-containing protein